MPKTLILIPSRLAADRLPGKPLLKINGLSIISHVIRKAQESNIGDAYVCTGDREIYEDVVNNGGNCILTIKKHNTGTDRIYEGFQKLNLFVRDTLLIVVKSEYSTIIPPPDPPWSPLQTLSLTTKFCNC